VVGVIESKQDLPMTRLNFGGTSQGSGQHTLGRLECTGKVKVEGMPTSCDDLWRIGNTMNGIYSIVANKKVQTVFCDFNKRLGSEKGINTVFLFHCCTSLLKINYMYVTVVKR
jgi:hypothetical protein